MSAKIRIRKLVIKNFRGVKELEWCPELGLNLILGGGDHGKTTVLEALSVLFHPTNNFNLSETDYWNRDVENGFSIEAVISKSDDFEFSSNNKIFWPWEWDKDKAVLPKGEDGGGQEIQIPVFRVIVTGSEDFDLSWEIIQPDESRDFFSAGIRKNIGLVRLSDDDKNDRDLRLVYGSALDRLLSDKNLKSKIANTVAQIPLKDELAETAKHSLSDLDISLEKKHLPSRLDIGLTTSRGISIGSLIGLFADKNGISLPVSTWGAGTRRMTSLQISAENESGARLTIIDEIERGLEPYRLRQLVTSLINSEAQSFVTTHSPVAISCALNAQLWYMDAGGSLGKLKRETIASQQKRDPETFLSKISVIVEGETEEGFVNAVLKSLFDDDPMNAGIRVCLGQGDAQVLGLLETLTKSGIQFGGFVDNDGAFSGRWLALKTEMGDKLFQWTSGCTESNILTLFPLEYLETLFKGADSEWDTERLRVVAERLETEDKTFTNIQQEAEKQSKPLLELIIEAATGSHAEGQPKAWKKHGRFWFKKADGSGGRELLSHLIATDRWNMFEPTLRPFFNSILELSGKPKVEVISL